jgi:hypothetical protein
MKTSELIKELVELLVRHGDLDVVCSHGDIVNSAIKVAGYNYYLETPGPPSIMVQ